LLVNLLKNTFLSKSKSSMSNS